MIIRSLCLDSGYLIKNPAWHVEESAWKAKQILRMLRRNRISPSSVCDVRCGAGEVLKQMQAKLTADAVLWGYDVSPQAIELARTGPTKDCTSALVILATSRTLTLS